MNKTELAQRTGGWWEDTGYCTMAETRDEQRAKVACGLKLQALADELHAPIASRRNRIADLTRSTAALGSQLYHRHHPVSDTKMISLCAAVVFLVAATITVFAASAAGNILTLIKFGWDLSTCIIVGLIGTALVTVIGERLHTKILAKQPVLDTLVVVIVSTLTVWALIDFGRGRGVMTRMLTQERPVESFVDDPAVRAQDSHETETNAPNEEGLRALFTDALTKLTVVADVAVGLLLGALVGLLTDDDFAGWRRLRREKSQMCRSQHELDQHVALIEMAKKRCAAGIIRARHHGASTHPPYLAAGITLFLLLAGALTAQAQENIRRDEAVLLDVSGSVGNKTDTHSVFKELLETVRQILSTEPADSRTWTFAITTESFGAGPQTLVRGWTPSAAGVFTDKINQARRQLVSSFEANAATLKPIAQGTDIFGAVWRAKAAIESDPNAAHHQKEIFLLSDMVNETPGFNMPALVATGATNMMQLARDNDLIVPLSGYRIFVVGASTANLTPQAWTTIKNFWSTYFAACGAELIVYSSEAAMVRK